MRARFNQMRKHVQEIVVFMDADPDELTGVEIADMRQEVQDLDQCMHEFSVYWNVLNT